VITECKPDLIHAHNVIAGKLASEFDIPFVYDDHEYWSVSMRAMKRTKTHHILSLRYKRWLVDRWEKQALDEASAVITTADTVTEEFRRRNSNVYSVPNFPSLTEIKAIKTDTPETNQLSSVYVGSDCTQSHPSPERNATGLVDLFIRNDVGNLTIIGDNRLQTQPHLDSVGFLPHQEMMNELARHHIGLLPWKKHWLHKYKHPNKPYQYAHAGLLTFAASDMVNVVASLKEYVRTFEDYDDLLKLLTEYKDHVDEVNKLKPKVKKYALDNLIWEKNEAKILEAYAKS
jgi:glycosyltransferase involved in cell wall biosynthesis